MTNSLLKLLITGGDGQVAQAMRHHPRAREFDLVFCSKDELNITQPDSIAKAFDHYQPAFVINTAAYTAVDQAEENKEQANLINHLGAQYLAQACEKYRLPLIHLSTDYIFDGKKTQPYTEDDKANPINVYGESKWLGEQAIFSHMNDYLILRVSGIFSEYKHNFFKLITTRATQQTPLRVVNDQITCPTYAGDIADAIYNVTQNKQRGIYHYCGSQAVSWYDFAVAILNEMNINTNLLTAISTADFQSAAKRPAYSVLDCNKIKRDFQIEQPSWKAAIKQLM